MASFSLFGGSTTARTLLNGETGYISPNGALATVADAITATGSVDIAVLGSLFSSTGNAIDLDGSALDLFVGNLGSVGALKTDAITANVTSSVFVSNDGYIFSGQDALDLRETDGAAIIRVNNTGRISGQSDGIVADAGTSTVNITNYGEISGGYGGVDILDGTATLTNFGMISGLNFGYDGGNFTTVDTVRNFGTIEGLVSTRMDDDVVLNRGTLSDVSLGDGNDRFDGRGGTVTGDVAGGLGDDVYIVSVSDISLVELADEGTDLVRSNVNFTLGINFEDLTLIGGGDRKGVGNDANNVITGNDGNNVLRGLKGNDTLLGGTGDDTLRGGRGNDELKGGTGDDILRGGANSDNLAGRDGDDILIGGLGKDTLTGGQGSDVFQFNRAADSAKPSGADRITDFELGIDRIDLSNLIDGNFQFLEAGGFGSQGMAVKVVVKGTDSLVRINVDGDDAGTVDMRIVLTGVTGVQEGDFIL